MPDREEEIEHYQSTCRVYGDEIPLAVDYYFIFYLNDKKYKFYPYRIDNKIGLLKEK